MASKRPARRRRRRTALTHAIFAQHERLAHLPAGEILWAHSTDCIDALLAAAGRSFARVAPDLRAPLIRSDRCTQANADVALFKAILAVRRDGLPRRPRRVSAPL